MPVQVACGCGAKFAAQDHLIGKTVPCPFCKQPLAISAGPAVASKPAAQKPVQPQQSQRFQTAANTAAQHPAKPAPQPFPQQPIPAQQPFATPQPFPGQQAFPQPFPGQAFPGQPFAAQPFTGQQPFPAQPLGNPMQGFPGQAFPAQGLPGQGFSGQGFPGAAGPGPAGFGSPGFGSPGFGPPGFGTNPNDPLGLGGLPAQGNFGGTLPSNQNMQSGDNNLPLILGAAGVGGVLLLGLVVGLVMMSSNSRSTPSQPYAQLGPPTQAIQSAVQVSYTPPIDLPSEGAVHRFADGEYEIWMPIQANETLGPTTIPGQTPPKLLMAMSPIQGAYVVGVEARPRGPTEADYAQIERDFITGASRSLAAQNGRMEIKSSKNTIIQGLPGREVLVVTTIQPPAGVPIMVEGKMRMAYTGKALILMTAVVVPGANVANEKYFFDSFRRVNPNGPNLTVSPPTLAAAPVVPAQNVSPSSASSSPVNSSPPINPTGSATYSSTPISGGPGIASVTNVAATPGSGSPGAVLAGSAAPIELPKEGFIQRFAEGEFEIWMPNQPIERTMPPLRGYPPVTVAISVIPNDGGFFIVKSQAYTKDPSDQELQVMEQNIIGDAIYGLKEVEGYMEFKSSMKADVHGLKARDLAMDVTMARKDRVKVDSTIRLVFTGKMRLMIQAITLPNGNKAMESVFFDSLRRVSANGANLKLGSTPLASASPRPSTGSLGSGKPATNTALSLSGQVVRSSDQTVSVNLPSVPAGDPEKKQAQGTECLLRDLKGDSNGRFVFAEYSLPSGKTSRDLVMALVEEPIPGVKSPGAVRKRDISLEGRPTFEIEFEQGADLHKAKIVGYGSKVYVLLFVGPKEKIKEKSVVDFLRSFRVGAA